MTDTSTAALATGSVYSLSSVTMPPAITEADIELGTSQVRAMFGGVSDMTLWRWMDNRGFPRPRKRSGRNFWVLSEVRAWRRQQDQVAA
jgi:predicted DNA-binding transcriptional regulator AlpA